MSHALHPVRLFRPYFPASNTVRAYRRGRSMKPFRTPQPARQPSYPQNASLLHTHNPQPVNLPKNSVVFRTNAPYRSAISRTGTARTRPGFSPTAVPPDSKRAESTAISSGHAKETYPAKQGFAPARHRELNPSCRPGTEEIRSPRITKARTNGGSVRKSRSGKPAACCS